MNSLINRSLSKTLAVIAVAASLMGATNVARAVLINVTVDAAGNLFHVVGIADKTQYMAANGGAGNNNANSNFAFLVTEVNRYNGVFDPNLPTPDNTPFAEYGSLGDVSSYNAIAGWDYVVLHFGNGGEGSPGGWWSAYYLGGDAASFTALPLADGLAGHAIGGFSSARYFNQHVVVDDQNHNVPDSGSTVISLGLALLAIGVMARKAKVG